MYGRMRLGHLKLKSEPTYRSAMGKFQKNLESNWAKIDSTKIVKF